MAPAGSRAERVTFERRGTVMADGYGNSDGPWAEQFTRWAKMMALRGGETVMASRLSGVQPFEVTVLADSDTRQVTPFWRMRQGHRIYNIRAVAARNGAEITMLVDEGVADG